MLRKSQYVHSIPLSGGRELFVHAISGNRQVFAPAMAAIVRYFETPHAIEEAVAELAARGNESAAMIQRSVEELLKQGILSRVSVDEEQAHVAARFSETYGRDPAELLDKYRREHAEGTSAEKWALGTPRTLADFGVERPVLRVVLLGDCDVQMELDLLRAEGAKRGYDVKVLATFREDLRALAEMPHDAVIVGALPGRREIAAPEVRGDPTATFIAEARDLLRRLRAATKAPILIHNLPVPTVQPLGFSDRGVHGHRNRFRRANLSLERLMDEFPGVYIVDVDAALAYAGKGALLDDTLVSYTHFGSLGWMLQRPESALAAVHGIFPDTAPLAAKVGGDPYGMETILARAHMDALMSILALDQKKCVIVDLDGNPWPGVLAETGAPFAWQRDINGAFSYIGLYFGLHEALKSLVRRGIVLACVSKNDEATVRQLWKYDADYPHDRLLHLEDFVTVRINWKDKVDNILSIAEELGFKLNSFVLSTTIQWNVNGSGGILPEVVVEGENPFALREWLLSDARLQPPAITAESASRTQMMQAQRERERERPTAADDTVFRQSLELAWEITRLQDQEDLPRIKELFDRTTQFNTTGRKFSIAELAEMLHRQDHDVFTMRLRDRFGDHGLVAACVVEAGKITALAVSCRVLGLDVEHRFMEAALEKLAPRFSEVSAMLIPTSRNLAARNIYKDHGFVADAEGLWRRNL